MTTSDSRRDFASRRACRPGTARALGLVFALVFALAVPASGRADGTGPARAAEDAFVASLLARMTLPEKVGQLVQGRAGAGATGPVTAEANGAAVRAGAVGSFLGVTGAEATRRLQRIAVEESRLGIPLLFAFDVVHGFRTVFPMPLAEAASWNLERIEGAARIAAVEAAAAGVHWTYAPMVDVARDPRWGRVVEGAGEDPWLGARIAEARVRGFQGESLSATDTLLATAKHFVAYGAADGGRDYDAADLSERELREAYLPPFEAAVGAGAAAVMVAFNAVNGVPAHANAELLTGVLREEMDFDGVVVSDYDGVAELVVHGVAADRRDAAALAFAAGVDVDMVSGAYTEGLPAALEAGGLAEADLDAAVARVLRMKRRLGLFEDPYRYSNASRERARTLTRAHRAAARALAIESIVLLSNRGGTLPLELDASGREEARVRTIAVVGPLADDPRAVLGGWSAAGRAEEAVSILAGLRAALPPGVELVHERGADVADEDEAGIGAAVAAARRADVALVVVGEDPGMSSEANNRTSLGLPGAQGALARAVVATGTPTVAVLVSGRPLSLPWLDRHAGAVLATWFLGTEAGHAVADVLTGRANPSGRLPITVPRSVGQVPVHHAALRSGRPHAPGERYVVRYLDSPVEPLYPFGHGLSYTRFEYGALELERERLEPDGTLRASVRVTNVGERAGVETAQLYLGDPVASVARPAWRLVGFDRLALAPGESARARFELEAADLAFPELAWPEDDPRRVAEAGEFRLRAGPSSAGGVEAGFALVRDWREGE